MHGEQDRDMNSGLDLRQLALNRGGSSSERVSGTPRRRWFSRYLVPAAILLGFAMLIAWAAGQNLLPVREVTVVPTIVKRVENRPAGTMLFQAPGWIEPRPTAINVPALAAGVIDQLLVVEGEQVASGQAVARLIDTDARLALEQARAALAIREGELDRARAEWTAARIRLENPVHLEAALADAEGMWLEAKTELDNLPRRIEQAEAEVRYTQQSMEGKRKAGAGVSAITLSRAEADYAAADARLRELRSREPNLQQRAEALARKAAAVRQQLSLLIEERRQLEEAEAKVATATAQRDQARLTIEQAELDLDRMVVRAPIAGRILRLVAAPGDRVMGVTTSGPHGNSAVVQMYDPSRLQVRADVRLEDVPLVEPGQPVEIETASARESIAGRVLLPTSSANIQKNTLEVKVELLDPPPNVTPEMLVTATFLASGRDEPDTELELQARLFAPAELIQTSETGRVLWVVDHRGRAIPRLIEQGSFTEGGLVEIASGLTATDRLIASGVEGLHSGMRVRIVGEDPRLGIPVGNRRETPGGSH